MISREAALAAGLKRYFTGQPCKRGHVVERWVAAQTCVECSRLRHQQWCSNNPAHTHAYQQARQQAYRRANPCGLMLKGAKQRAKAQGVPFDLTEADIVIPEVCPVLGIPLARSRGKLSDASPSLDRILPELGYVRGNVAVISYLANALKRAATPWQLMQVAQYSCDRTFVAT